MVKLPDLRVNTGEETPAKRQGDKRADVKKDNGGARTRRISSIGAIDDPMEKGVLRSYGDRKMMMPVSKARLTLKTLDVDPTRTWVNPDINPRRQDWLERDINGNVSQLRDEMVAESQRNPALARLTTEGPNEGMWEIIDGSRRRAAALLENSKRADTFPLLIQTGNIDDADARVLARAELKGQHKLSPYERAMQIKQLISGECANLSIKEIAGVAGLSVDAVKGYKMVAEIPESVIALLENPLDLEFKSGLTLARQLKKLKQSNASLHENTIDNLCKSGVLFSSSSKLLAHFKDLLPQEKLVLSDYVGKYADKSGRNIVEVKSVRNKPGEFTLRVLSGGEKVMDDMMTALTKHTSKG